VYSFAYWSGPMETAWPHLFISTDCHTRINIAPSSLFRQAGHWDRKPERATFHVDHVAGVDQWDGRPHSAFGLMLVVWTDPQSGASSSFASEAEKSTFPWPLGHGTIQYAHRGPHSIFRANARCGSTCEKAGCTRRDLVGLGRASPYVESDMVKSVNLHTIRTCGFARWPYIGRL